MTIAGAPVVRSEGGRRRLSLRGFEAGVRRLIQRRGSAANLVAAMPTDLIPEATNDRRSDLDGLAMMWLDGALAVPSAWKDVRDMAAWSRLFGRQA